MRKKYKNFLTIVAAVLPVVVLLCLFLPAIHYHLALRQMENGTYTKAYQNLLGCRGYRNSEKLLQKFTVQYETLTIEAILHKEKITGKSKTVYTYDAMGNITLEQAYDAKGELVEETRGEFQYDEAGRLILKRYRDANGQSMRDTRKEHRYTYDDDGNLAQVEKYDLDGNLLSVDRRHYDEQGSVIREDRYNSEHLTGTTMWEYEYAFDDAGRQTMVAKYDTNGNLDHRIEYIYDRHGNKIKEIYYGTNGEVSYTTSWEYDGRGNLRKETEHDSTGQVYEKTVWSWNHSKKTTTFYDYDAKGALNETRIHTYTDPVVCYHP